MNNKTVPSQTSKKRKRYDADHFDRPIEKNFITDNNRAKFNHICGKCLKRKYCDKCKAAIILKCDEFKYKGVKYGEK